VYQISSDLPKFYRSYYRKTLWSHFFSRTQCTVSRALANEENKPDRDATVILNNDQGSGGRLRLAGGSLPDSSWERAAPGAVIGDGNLHPSNHH